MRRMVSIVVCFCLVFFGLANVGFAQAPAATTFAGNFKVGFDADGAEWRTEVTVTNQTSGPIGFNVSYPTPLYVKGTGGFEGGSWATFGGMQGPDNTSWVLTSISGQFQEGELRFDADTMWSAQLQTFLPVYTAQVIVKKFVNGQTVFVEAHGVSTTSGGFGQSFICQALNSDGVETGLVIRNDNPTKVKILVELNDLFHHNTRPWATAVVKVKPGKTRTFMMSELFPGLDIRDGNLNLKVKGSNTVTMSCIRTESGLPSPGQYDLPVFYGRSLLEVDTVSIVSVRQKDSGKLILHATSSMQDEAVRPVLTATIHFFGTSSPVRREMFWAGEDFVLSEFFEAVQGVEISSSLGGFAFSSV